jgi:hypothetical protein
MIDISHINIFDTKIIHDERECERARFMIPEAGGIDAFVIPKRGQFPAKVFVGKDTHLQKALDGASHFEVDPSVLGMLCKIILFDNPAGKKAEWHFHILKVFEGSGKIESFYVNTHILLHLECSGHCSNAILLC